MMKSMLSEERVVLVTGATSGFGRSCAERFLSEGFRVVATGRRQERLDELLKSETANWPPKEMVAPA